MFKRILAAVDAVSFAAAVVGAACLFSMSMLMLAEVVFRNFLNFSLVFSWEYSAYMMATVFFGTAAYTLRVRGHVRVSLLNEALPPRAAYILEVAATTLGLIIATYLTFALVDFAAQSFARGARSFLPSETPLWPPQAIVAAGAALLTLQLGARLVRLLIGEPADLELPEDALPGEEA